MTYTDIKNEYMLKILIYGGNNWYNWFKWKFWGQTHLQIRNIEMNVQIETRLVSQPLPQPPLPRRPHNFY